MSFILVMGIAVALAMDCFAVSMGLACGPKGLTNRQTFRMAFFFGLFQFGMPLAGWLAGDELLGFFRGIDHWVAFILLGFIGGRMIYESFHQSDEERACRPDRTKGIGLLLLATATSIDALAVGLSLGVLKAQILLPAFVIGGVCFIITIIGSKLGPALGRAAGKRAELLGGVLLIAIGIKTLVEHLWK